MTKYIISDLHLGHENIIEYCQRPFSSADEMDRQLIENWNSTVDESDYVYFLGDLSFIDSGMTVDAWLEYLNGEILFVRGNHDSGLSQNAPVHVVENCTIQHGRYEFFMTHKPPDNVLNCWTIHGHTHNNQPVVHPFVHPERQTVNVSAEFLNYTPLEMDELVYMIDQRERYRDVNDAPCQPSRTNPAE